MLSLTPTIKHQTTVWTVRYCRGIFLDGLQVTTKNRSGWTSERCTFQIRWMHYFLSQQAQSYWRCSFWLHWSRFDSQQEQQTYLSSKTLRQALKPTQPPIQWAQEAFCLGVKSPGHEAENSLKSTAQVKNEWSYTSNPPTDLHGIHTFTFTEYSVHVLPVMLLYKVININFTSNNIMSYWELQICFTSPTTFPFTFTYELDVISCSSVL